VGPGPLLAPAIDLVFIVAFGPHVSCCVSIDPPDEGETRAGLSALTAARTFAPVARGSGRWLAAFVSSASCEEEETRPLD